MQPLRSTSPAAMALLALLAPLQWRAVRREGTLLTCEVCGGNWLRQAVLRGHLFPPTWLIAGLCGYRRYGCPFQ